jgi:hypothetical protein
MLSVAKRRTLTFEPTFRDKKGRFILNPKIELFFARQIVTSMSSPQEYHYTAYPTMPHCQGTSCYCFHGKNQMDEFFSDSDSETSEVMPSSSSSGWRLVNDSSDWAIALNDQVFRHPRVLLAYFRFVSLNNEIAKITEEYIHIPTIPKDVKDYMLDHVSFKETTPEFEEEVSDLLSWIHLLSSND